MNGCQQPANRGSPPNQANQTAVNTRPSLLFIIHANLRSQVGMKMETYTTKEYQIGSRGVYQGKMIGCKLTAILTLETCSSAASPAVDKMRYNIFLVLRRNTSSTLNGHYVVCHKHTKRAKQQSWQHAHRSGLMLNRETQKAEKQNSTPRKSTAGQPNARGGGGRWRHAIETNNRNRLHYVM